MKKALVVLLLASTAFAGEIFKVWVSDEGCASGRAKGGVFTGTNPDCARKCVNDGKAMVLVDEQAKALYKVANPERSNRKLAITSRSVAR